MIYKIEVSNQKGFPDKHGEHVCHDVKDIGIAGASKVKYCTVYKIEGDVTGLDITRIASELLIDPITEEYNADTQDSADKQKPAKGEHIIEVWLKGGVTDTVAESVQKAVKDLGITKPLKVKTGHKFTFSGTATTATIKQIAEKLLANPMVQEYTLQ
jgi:phosphoribosylformylglycinamidine (FGAM) synthase PurS component